MKKTDRQTDRDGKKGIFSSLLRRKKSVRQVSAGHHRNRIVIYQRGRQRRSASSCSNSCHHVYGYERDERWEKRDILYLIMTPQTHQFINYYYIERERYLVQRVSTKKIISISQNGLLLSFFFFSSVQIWGEVCFSGFLFSSFFYFFLFYFYKYLD